MLSNNTAASLWALAEVSDLPKEERQNSVSASKPWSLSILVKSWNSRWCHIRRDLLHRRYVLLGMFCKNQQSLYVWVCKCIPIKSKRHNFCLSSLSTAGDTALSKQPSKNKINLSLCLLQSCLSDHYGSAFPYSFSVGCFFPMKLQNHNDIFLLWFAPHFCFCSNSLACMGKINLTEIGQREENGIYKMEVLYLDVVLPTQYLRLMEGLLWVTG